MAPPDKTPTKSREEVLRETQEYRAHKMWVSKLEQEIRSAVSDADDAALLLRQLEKVASCADDLANVAWSKGVGAAFEEMKGVAR